MSTLPEQGPQIPGYGFFHHYQPAMKMGGDYCDYIPMTNGRVAVVVADLGSNRVGTVIRWWQLAEELRQRWHQK